VAFDISVSTIAECKDELEVLAKQHHAEVNVFYDVPLDIDWRKYEVASKSYRLIICRVDGKLVGWAGFFLADHIRHIGYRIAKEDWYYVMPEFRGMGIGKALFKYAENVLRDADVRRVMISCKVDHDHTGLIESLGYIHYEKNFTKVIA
jgi:GNAT superfamily N-acetyltransferase|tara:strand:- start:562 stop:1008 length:447 start_codon:yes stop_codon:yes gene_type:complete